MSRKGIVAILILMICAVGFAWAASVDTMDAEDHRAQAERLAQAGEYEQAIGEYEAVLQAEPDDVSALIGLGAAYREQGRVDEALAQFQRAAEILPEDPGIHSSLAGLHFQKGNDYAQSSAYDQAIAEYEAVLEVEPEHVSAMTNLGVVYYMTGQWDQAIAAYDSALGIAPADADIHSNLGAAYVQLGQLDQALDEFSTAVTLEPDLLQAHFGLGVVYLQLGRNQEALEAFERFMELDTGQDTMATEQARQYLEYLKGQ
jgi:protein O-GlcNAc transferase